MEKQIGIDEAIKILNEAHKFFEYEISKMEKANEKLFCKTE